MSGRKRRLDELLVERGMVDTAVRAQALIRAGLVFCGEQRLDKPGVALEPDVELRLKEPPHPFVSRGGVKLLHALNVFSHSPAGEVAMDIGASTGGFTDCLLQQGAARVYSIDVGRGQLHHKIASHPLVVAREQVHVDDLKAVDFDTRPTLAVVDVSFISATRALAPMRRVLMQAGKAIVLVKPQFEVRREDVPQGGIIRDAELHRAAVKKVADAAREAGFEVLGDCESPIEGGEGNREFFLYLGSSADESSP